MAREIPRYIQQLGIGASRDVNFTTAAADLTKGVSEQLGNLALDIHNRGVEIERLSAKSQLEQELLRQYNESQSDPAKLQEAQAGFKKGFIDGIKSPALAEEFQYAYDSLAANYVNKATLNLRDQQKQEFELKLRQGIQTLVESGKSYASNLFSDIPEHASAAERSLGSGMVSLEQMISAKNDDGSFVFSPAQQVAYKNSFEAEVRRQASAARQERVNAQLSSDPATLIQQIESGALDNVLTDKEKERYTKEAITKFKDNQSREDMITIIKTAARDQEIYNDFVSGAPDILQKVEKYRLDHEGDAGAQQLADYMRKATLKANPIPADEMAQVKADIAAKFANLKLKTKKDGTVDIRNSDVTMEDAFRLQREIIKQQVSGVKGLDTYIKRLSPALAELAKKERGYNDTTFDSIMSTFVTPGYKYRNAEAYDSGYQVIQDWLEKQGKDGDYVLKSNMIGDLIEAIDNTPEHIDEKSKEYDAYLKDVANSVILNTTRSSGMARIPAASIRRLQQNPELADKFDEMFGAGSAARVLGK